MVIVTVLLPLLYLGRSARLSSGHSFGALPTVPLLVLVGLLVPLLPQAARAVAPAIASIASVDAGRANFIDSPRCQGTYPRPGSPGSRWRASHHAVEPWLAAFPVPARVQPGFGENHKNFPAAGRFPEAYGDADSDLRAKMSQL